jgi:hypothetical protein
VNLSCEAKSWQLANCSWQRAVGKNAVKYFLRTKLWQEVSEI